MSDRIVLGIESAIAGGSVCLSANACEVGSWVGNESVSRAEELLPNIDRLLRQNSIGLDDIDRIIVSVGPGSFTGIKVGISTVLGLRAAAKMTCLGISALQAMSLISANSHVTSAVPMGRGVICRQSFGDGKVTSPPKLVDEAGFAGEFSSGNTALVLHGSLFDPERFPRSIDVGWNIASLLCAAIDSEFATTQLRPLFVERNFSTI